MHLRSTADLIRDYLATSRRQYLERDASDSAGRAVVSTYARTLGCHADSGAFDLYARQALGPEAILKIHSEGDTTFAAITRGYPARFSGPAGAMADIGQHE